MITSIELLNRDECTRVESQIKELRDHWIPRGSQVNGFFTLGAASYLDDLDEYHERRAALNPVLRSSFGWLYDRVVEFLERRLHAPVTLADNLALPGFHIWLAPAVFVTPDASVHFDLQYLRTWATDAPDVDYSRPLSFTLPIRLPRRGGGLNVWDITYERYRRFAARVNAPLQPMDVTVLLDRMRHPYTPGAIVVHSGHLMHQIGEIEAVDADDERVTLQGHALCQRGEWKLYW